MSTSESLRNVRAIFLTLLSVIGTSGCASLEPRVQVTQNCSSRVYVSAPIGQQLSSRNGADHPSRLAVIPFAVPANLAGSSNELPGLGNTLAWRVHAEALASGEFPITEVFNRQDWPGKKEEFFTGNFGAISLAQEAGYGLVLTGFIENLRDLDSLTAHTKLIDVSSGITLWYGKSSVRAVEHRDPTVFDSMWRSTDKPAEMYTASIADDLGRCIVQGILSQR